MSKINLKQCDQCGAMLDANSAFCGNCGKQFGSSGVNSPTPLLGEYQQHPITTGFSHPGYVSSPSQPGFGSSPSQPGDVSSPSQRSRSNRIYLVVLALLVLMLLGTFVFFLGKESSQVSTGTTPGTSNQSVTKAANNNATGTVITASPTVSTTTSPDLTTTPTTSTALTATPTTPVLVTAETLPESITLKCDCSDPVVVTLTKIVVEPQQNRMIWSLTFFNNSQRGASGNFNQFRLENGDQVNYPTTDYQYYDATGVGIDTGVSLQAGETQQGTLTFSFVPYKNIPYTLVSGISSVTFNPVVIQF